MNELHTTILTGMLASIREYLDEHYAGFHRNRSGLLLLDRHRHAKAGWCKYEPADWLGRSLSSLERKQFSLALRELEAQGLILREANDKGRTIWISLTEQGQQVAQQLMEE